MIEEKNLKNLRASKRDARCGFTLIELLVVIAIVAILASILLPVLAAAQKRAQAIESLNTTKQWAAAQNMYVDDNNQYLPLTKIPNGSPGTVGGYNEDTPMWADLSDIYRDGSQLGNARAMQILNSVWFDALPNYVGGRPLYFYSSVVQNGITLYNNTKNLFHCPSALIDPSQLDVTKQIVFEYGMNSKGLWGHYGTQEAGNDTNSPLRATIIKHPSAFVMFADNKVNTIDAPGWDTANLNTLGSPQCYCSRVSMRHNFGANLGFSDGHAAWYKYGYITVDVAGKPGDPGQPDINWGYDGTSVDGYNAPPGL